MSNHIGEIWRKDGDIGWVKITHNETLDNPERDGGAEGIGCKFGKYSRKRKCVIWHSRGGFYPCLRYSQFVKWMHREYRYIEGGRPESFGPCPFGKRCDE